MTVMGIDPGAQRIGLAVTDPLGAAAHGLPTVEAQPDGSEIDRIAELVRERNVERIVVGLPISMDGTEGPQARKVRGFIKRLRAAVPDVPVETVDERLTSARAHRALSEEGVGMRERGRRVDRMAAQLILTRWLNRQADAEDEEPET